MVIPNFAPLKQLSPEDLDCLTTSVENKLFSPGNNYTCEEILKLVALLNELRLLSGPKGHGVRLIEHGPNKIAVIKAIRTAIPGTGLAEAKQMSEKILPFPDRLRPGEAEAIVRAIREQGGKAEVVGTVEHYELHGDNSTDE